MAVSGLIQIFFTVLKSLSRLCLLSTIALMVGGLLFIAREPLSSRQELVDMKGRIAGGSDHSKKISPPGVILNQDRPVEAEDHWMARWRELTRRPAGSDRTAALIALLEMMAAENPTRALSWAQGEPEPLMREELVQAVLRGWGGVDARAAVDWARVQTFLDEGQALAAVFHGAARDPDALCRLALELSAQEPARTGDYGSYLAAALQRVGAFDRAVAFALESPLSGRVELLNAAYAGWGDTAPLDALNSLNQIVDPAMKQLAFSAAVSRWAHRNAPEVAAYAETLPAGEQRTFAFSTALREWAASDVTAAATWLARHDASLEFDLGAAVAATLPDSVQLPRFATAMAENITDARLRTRVLATVVHQWAATDPVAARDYAEHSPDLSSADRLAVLAAFGPDFSPVSLLP